MHFLGLMGMPRRIPDYPDVYAYWNWWCTFGSFLTLTGTIIFVINVYLSLMGFGSIFSDLFSSKNDSADEDNCDDLDAYIQEFRKTFQHEV